MRTVLWLLVIAALGLGASHAVAGSQRTGAEVTFHGTPYEGIAFGHFTAVRHSPDKVQYIGCTFQSNGVGVGRSALCEAMNADGEFRSCTTVEPAKVDVLSTLDHNAQLSFSWNKSGVCTHVAVDKYSFQEPYTL